MTMQPTQLRFLAALISLLAGAPALAQAPPGGEPAGGGAPPAGGPAAPGGAAEKPLETLRPPPTEGGELKILQDRAQRNLSAKAYDKAMKDFERLAQLQPEILEYRLNFALCLYETGKLPDARERYDAILSQEPDNIQALLAFARILCKTAQSEKDAAKRDDLVGNARDTLRRAARNGLNALRALKVYPEFTALKTDVALQLDLIREPQAFRVDSPSGRDPFYNPLPTKLDPGTASAASGGDEGKRGLTAKEQEDLVKRLEVLFADLDPLVATNDFVKLGEKWGEIDELLRKGNQITVIDLGPKFKDLMKRHKEKLPLIKSLLLRSYYTEGERMIEGMKGAYDQQDYRRVFEVFGKLEAHAKKMVATDEQFAEPAATLLAEGKPFLERAQKLQEIEQIKLNISAVVMGGGVAQAIVNNRILAEGDFVYDLQGNPIADLRVVQIRKRKVKFEYKQLEFEPRDQLKTK